jgi:hypothetical protein
VKVFLSKVGALVPSEADFKEFQNETIKYGWACSLKPLNNSEFYEIGHESISQPEFLDLKAQGHTYGLDVDLYLSWLHRFLFESAACRKVCKKHISRKLLGGGYLNNPDIAG